MRAKMTISTVTDTGYSDILKMNAVYGGDKNNEDNTFAKATPSATFEMQIDNPLLKGTFKPGQKFYVDFTLIE